MKTSFRLGSLQNLTLLTVFTIIATNGLQAKPDKGNGGKGSGGHSEKQNGSGKTETKGKADKGDKGDKGDKRSHKNSEKDDHENFGHRKPVFRESDRAGVIRYFTGFRENERGLPPGLAKNYLRGKPLPPGWQTRVYGGSVIGDDLRDYLYPLSHSLFPGLEEVPDTRLYLYGNRVVRVYEPRREVIDFFEVPSIRLN